MTFGQWQSVVDVRFRVPDEVRQDVDCPPIFPQVKPMARSSLQPLLFSRATLFDALRNQSSAIQERVQAVSETILRARPDVELIEDLANALDIVPLELNMDGRSLRREEIQIDVSGDPMRALFSSGGPVFVPGLRVVVSVPFRGDQHLWELQPSTFNLSPPRGEVRTDGDGDGESGTLEIAFEQPADQPFENIKHRLDEITNSVSSYIANQRSDLAGYTGRLRNEIASALSARRARLGKHDELAQLLGIPERRPDQRDAQTRAPRAAIETPSTDDLSWDVFVSHASEDKESFARPLAKALEGKGLKVWFDENTLKVGDSLRRSIDRGLARSRYGVVVISKAFLSKEWPQRELDGLVAREDDGGKVVLPVWHEITAADVKRRSPTLADRLAISSSKGVDEVVVELLRVLAPEA